MKNIILCGNGPLSNRGCEAIYLSTRFMLNKHYRDTNFLLASFADDSQEKNIKDPYINLTLNRKRWTASWFNYQIKRLYDKNINYTEVLEKLPKNLDEYDMLLSIGGDNYAIDYGPYLLKQLITINNYAKKCKLPVIIWGASIGPFDKEPRIKEEILTHLKTIDAIVVRETETLEYLRINNIVENIHYAPDPAFILEPKKINAPEIKNIMKTDNIGLNISPILAKYLTNGNIKEWIALAAKIIENLVKETKGNVLLIPHVYNNYNDINMDDMIFMQAVYDKINSMAQKSTLLIKKKYDCQELKWIISNTKVFIGARTHSTIAALSSYVPCLSIAYSRKAIGINKLVYGNLDNVLLIQNLNQKSFIEKVCELLQNKETNRTSLLNHIPHIKKQTKNITNILNIVDINK